VVAMSNELSEQLVIAVKNGNSTDYQNLIKSGADVNYKKDGKYIIHYASEYDNFLHELIKYRGVDFEVEDDFKNTPFITHCRAENKYSISLFKEIGANLDAQNSEGKTGLHYLIEDRYNSMYSITRGKNSPSPNIKDNEGNTPLIYLAKKPHGEVKSKFKSLITMGADLTITDKEGNTPLHIVLKYLLQNRVKNWSTQGTNSGRNVQYKIKNGLFTYHSNGIKSRFPVSDQEYCAGEDWSPEGLDIYYSGIDLALSLIKAGADLNAADENCNTPLLLACELGEPRVIRGMLKEDVHLTATNNNGETVLHKAAISERIDGFKVIIKVIKNINYDQLDNFGWSVIHHLATKEDSVDILKELQKKKVNCSIKSTKQKDDYQSGITALEIAEKNQINSIITYLEEDKSEYTTQEIIQAIYNGEYAKVDKYLKNGGSPELNDNKSNSFVSFAVYGERLEVLELLLKNGADVNGKDENGNILLRCVAQLAGKGPGASTFIDEYMESVKMARVILQYDIDLRLTREGSEQGALRIASDCSTEITKDIVNALVKRYPDYKDIINMKDSEGFTAMHCAARSGDLDRVKVLVENGADVNLAEDYGFIPIHEAIIAGKFDVVRYLIENGADLNHKISSGYSSYTSGDNALDIAKKSRNRDIEGMVEKSFN
jgi:ankyrin repeat protein